MAVVIACPTRNPPTLWNFDNVGSPVARSCETRLHHAKPEEVLPRLLHPSRPTAVLAHGHVASEELKVERAVQSAVRGGGGALLVKLKGTTRDAVEAVVTLVCRGLIHVPTEGLERATPLAEQRLDVRARFDGVTGASSVGRERWARANQRDGG